MENLNSLLESANNYKVLQSDAAKLANKWEKTGLLEGLASSEEKSNMAMILENQAKQLVTESSLTGAGTAGASFSAGTGEQWAGVALPLVRKIFGQISSKEFVSVQPMNLPSGLVFYLDFQYGTAKAGFGSGDSVYGNKGTNLPFGNTNAGGAYGAGRFGYSVNNITSSVSDSDLSTGSVDFADVNFDSDFVATGSYAKATIATSSLDSNFDAEAIRAFRLTGANAPADSAQYPQFTKITSAGDIVFIVDVDSIDPATASEITYTLAPVDNARGDFEDKNTALNPNNDPINIPEINIQMESSAIVAKTRKLKAVWTPEFAQDLNAYHAMDAEAELTSVMSEYISLEIDLEILDMLIESAAAGDEYWSAKNNQVINAAGTAFEAASSDFYNTQGQWFQTLGTKIQKLSNNIHQKTLRGGANFLVISPKVATILESIPGFASSSDGDVTKASYAFGIQKAGTLNSRYTVYKNPYMNENVVLAGFRGGQFLEAGAVFAPYVPLIMTPMVYDPNTFTPRKGLLTRYAKKMVRPEFYGRIYINGLNEL